MPDVKVEMDIKLTIDFVSTTKSEVDEMLITKYKRILRSIESLLQDDFTFPVDHFVRESEFTSVKAVQLQC